MYIFNISNVYVILQLVTDIRFFFSVSTFKLSASRYIIIIYYDKYIILYIM